MKISNERWKPVKDYEDLYIVSNHGRVMKINTLQVLKQYTQPTGYNEVRLHRNGKQKHFRVHRLVAFAFIANSDPINRIFVHHVNGVRDCNHSSNLRWVSTAEHFELHKKIKKYSHKRKINFDKKALPKMKELILSEKGGYNIDENTYLLDDSLPGLTWTQNN